MRRAILPTTPSSVAENSMVWRADGVAATIFSMSSMKPMSSMRSASSSTRISQLREIDLARFHVVDQAAWGGNQDFRILRQQLHLFRVRHAAQDRDARRRRMWAVYLFGRSRDLQGQFAGRGQHQHLWLGSLETRRRSPRARADCASCAAVLPAGVSSALAQLVQCRQHEGGGLARTGLRRDQQVAAGDGGRNGLRLDWRRGGVTGIGNSLDEGRVEA